MSEVWKDINGGVQSKIYKKVKILEAKGIYKNIEINDYNENIKRVYPLLNLLEEEKPLFSLIQEQGFALDKNNAYAFLSLLSGIMIEKVVEYYKVDSGKKNDFISIFESALVKIKKGNLFDLGEPNTEDLEDFFNEIKILISRFLFFNKFYLKVDATYYRVNYTDPYTVNKAIRPYDKKHKMID